MKRLGLSVSALERGRCYNLEPKVGLSQKLTGCKFSILIYTDNNIVDCVSAVHPSLVEKSEIDSLGVPTQFVVSEFDEMFTPEFKKHALDVLPTLGLDYDYRYFTGLYHGFATRGDLNNPKQKAGLEGAKNAASAWFRQNLSS